MKKILLCIMIGLLALGMVACEGCEGKAADDGDYKNVAFKDPQDPAIWEKVGGTYIDPSSEVIKDGDTILWMDSEFTLQDGKYVGEAETEMGLSHQELAIDETKGEIKMTGTMTYGEEVMDMGETVYKKVPVEEKYLSENSLGVYATDVDNPGFTIKQEDDKIFVTMIQDGQELFTEEYELEDGRYLCKESVDAGIIIELSTNEDGTLLTSKYYFYDMKKYEEAMRATYEGNDMSEEQVEAEMEAARARAEDNNGTELYYLKIK